MKIHLFIQKDKPLQVIVDQIINHGFGSAWFDTKEEAEKLITLLPPYLHKNIELLEVKNLDFPPAPKQAE